MFAALVGLAAPQSARAQRTISNVATAEWDSGAERVTRSSNRVDIVTEAQAAAPGNAATYRLADSGPATAAIGLTRCGAGAGVPITFGPAYAALSPANMGLVATSSYRPGEPLVILFDHAAGNVSRQVADTVTVDLRTADGDRERLILTETGADTDRFAGALPTIGGAVPTVADCRITVRPGATTGLSIFDANGAEIARAAVSYLIDPFGIVFDSATGEPVTGGRVTLVDADTGRPADVFGDDGVSAYPSTVVTDTSVTDAGGTRYDFPPGDYRFPLTRPGHYRLVVEPPAPYTAPSKVVRADLVRFNRPDGPPYTIDGASFGETLRLSSPAPVRVDVPVDAPPGVLTIVKTASVATADIGDIVRYTIVVRNRDALRASGPVTLADRVPTGFRYRSGSLRRDGAPLPATFAAGMLSAALPSIPAGGTSQLTYVLEILGSARAGDAVNRAQVTNGGGVASAFADAVVRVSRETLSGRMTITGRVTDGGCSVDPGTAPGIAGVRIMLEDGSYAVTDRDGRYHFEGVTPGIHVVQLDDSSMPTNRSAIACGSGTRGAGRAWSRFVEGGGGAHKRVDFRAAPAPDRAVARTMERARAPIASDAAAAGAETDWLKGAEPGTEFLFPRPDYNPRARVTRVAIKHPPGRPVRLMVNGKTVDPLTFEGTATSPDGRVAVTRWRGIPLQNATTRLKAVIGQGADATTLTRAISFANSAIRADIVTMSSVLVADGVTRPVIAVRFTDRDGRPVHGGLLGTQLYGSSPDT